MLKLSFGEFPQNKSPDFMCFSALTRVVQGSRVHNMKSLLPGVSFKAPKWWWWVWVCFNWQLTYFPLAMGVFFPVVFATYYWQCERLRPSESAKDDDDDNFPLFSNMLRKANMVFIVRHIFSDLKQVFPNCTALLLFIISFFHKKKTEISVSG